MGHASKTTNLTQRDCLCLLFTSDSICIRQSIDERAKRSSLELEYASQCHQPWWAFRAIDTPCLYLRTLPCQILHQDSLCVRKCLLLFLQACESELRGPSLNAKQSQKYLHGRTPGVDSSQINKHTPSKATYAEVIRAGPSTPTIDPWQLTKDIPNKATGAEAFQSRPSTPMNMDRWYLTTKRLFIPKSYSLPRKW